MKRILAFTMTAWLAASALAADVKISTFRYAGPYEVRTP